jgi:hypothetical protein
MELAPSLCRCAFVLAMLSFPLCTLTAIACDATESAPAKAATGSGKRKLLLFAKNPVTWAIVKGGAKGKVVYRESTGAFTLNAAGLRPRSAYTLIRYADTPPQVDILARGESDRQGNLEVRGIWRKWTKKFWLVPAEDAVGKVGEAGSLQAWRPDRYLFEEKPLGIPCNCPEPDEK